jgi:hypothetical protein
MQIQILFNYKIDLKMIDNRVPFEESKENINFNDEYTIAKRNAALDRFYIII